MMNSQKFDVVVVGAGSAGCVLARRLAESGERSVLLVEAGPNMRAETPAPLRDGWGLPRGADWPFDWGFESEPDESGGVKPVRRGRVLGGTSWLTRFGVRGAASDFDAWAARGNPGWAFADVLPVFKRLETDLEFKDQPWHGSDGPMVITRYPALDRSDVHRASLEAFAGAGFAEVEDHNSPDAVGFGPMPMTTSAGRRQTTLDAYLPPDVDLPTLRIVTDAGVDRIAIEAGRAKGVRLIDGSQVEADEVICAAGVYGSPCLLMRSGVGPADQLRALGIRIVADLPGVGANLADHPGADLDSGWRGAHVPARPTLHSIATRRSTSQPTEAPPDLMFWVTDPEGEDPRFAFDPILLKPESRGSVRLRSADPLDKPRITLPKPTARDVDRLMEGYALGIELANDPAIRRLASGPAPRGGSQARLRRLVVDGTYSIPHVVGTCRMGPSPADGDVVDATGCVHGIDALRVADTSVIPDAVAGFPQLVAIMLAERIATFV